MKTQLKMKQLMGRALVGIAFLTGGFASGLDLGVQAGANIGSASTSGIATPSSTSLMIGVMAEEYLAKNIQLQPELNYMGQGTGVSYLAIPVMLKYKFLAENSSFRPFVAVGPEIDIKLQGANTNPFAAALDFDAGIHYIMAPTYSLYLVGRYSLGLTNTSTIAGVDSKLRNFHILGGVLFAI